MYPLKHTAAQYDRVITACEWAKFEDSYDHFQFTREAFLELEPSLATAALAKKFEDLNGSLDRLKQIIADLYELRNRALREEALARKEKVHR